MRHLIEQTGAALSVEIRKCPEPAPYAIRMVQLVLGRLLRLLRPHVLDGSFYGLQDFLGLCRRAHRVFS